MIKKHAGFAVFCMIILLVVAGCGGQERTRNSKDGEEEYIIRFAHVVSPSTAKGQAAVKFGELIEERTDGQITVKIYPESQLGSDREIIEQMQSGAVQMNAPFTGVIPSFEKAFEVFDLPFVFEDRDHAYNTMHGELGNILTNKMENQGLRILGFWDGGFKHITNSVKPINKPEDMHGLKIRTSQSPLLISQFKALGAGGISVDFSELYTALQTGTVDGQENPLSNVVSKRFYEVQDYLTLSEHGYMGYALMINDKFYQNLPNHLQIILDEVVEEVTKWQWEQSINSETEYMEILEQADIEIVELNAEQKKIFLEVMGTAYDHFKKIEGSEEILKALENGREEESDIDNENR